jgi:hypothetical protein
MAPERKHEDKPERLAAGLRANQTRTRPRRARKGPLRAQPGRNTVVELRDGMLVNFIYDLTGLGSFADDLRKAIQMTFHGFAIPVMPLQSIRKSKAAVRRDKDPAHIHGIDKVLRLRGTASRATAAHSTRRPRSTGK